MRRSASSAASIASATSGRWHVPSLPDHERACEGDDDVAVLVDAAVGVFVGSPLVVLYALAGGPVWNAFVRPWEEADLERRFGDPYRRYRAAVRCWVPRLTPYRG